MTKLLAVVLVLGLGALWGCASMTAIQPGPAPYCLPAPKMKKPSMEPYC